MGSDGNKDGRGAIFGSSGSKYAYLRQASKWNDNKSLQFDEIQED